MVERFASLPGSRFHIWKNEIPKMMYSVVQTGPNTQFDGLKEGWLSMA